MHSFWQNMLVEDFSEVFQNRRRCLFLTRGWQLPREKKDGGDDDEEEERAYDSNDDAAQQPITWQERRWRNRR